MFYLMFGKIASEGEFDLPRTHVVIANLDPRGPKLRTGAENVPGGIKADTISELVVEVLRSEDLADLLEVSTAPGAETGRAAVDSQEAQVAIVIPEGFSSEFADLYGLSTIEFYLLRRSPRLR